VGDREITSFYIGGGTLQRFLIAALASSSRISVTLLTCSATFTWRAIRIT